MKNSDKAELLHELQSGGYKLTKLRQVLIDIFLLRRQPLLLKDIQGFLKHRDLNVHRATLYREISFLEKRKIIVPVSLPDSKIRYEFADRKHHHHVVCVECKNIEDVELEDDVKSLEELVVETKGFTITRHTLEFFGICGNCQKV